MISFLLRSAFRLLGALLMASLLFAGLAALLVGGGGHPGAGLIVCLALGVVGYGLWRLLRLVGRATEWLAKFQPQQSATQSPPIGAWVRPRTALRRGRAQVLDSWSTESVPTGRRPNELPSTRPYLAEYKPNTAAKYSRRDRQAEKNGGRS